MPRQWDNIRIAPDGGTDALERVIRKKAGTAETPAYHVVRQSVDARRRTGVQIVYSVREGPAPDGTGLDALAASVGRPTDSNAPRPLVVGTGPAGLFAGLTLAKSGLRPILIEQGRPVGHRIRDVARFWAGGTLDPYSNVPFGEGGAGTFSDGKLTTGIRNPRVRAVFEELVRAGAPPEILYLSRPHIGTDRLPDVLRAVRKTIEALGGAYRFSTRLSGLEVHNGTVTAARLSPTDDSAFSEEALPVRDIVLAIGHSARATQDMLLQAQVKLQPKPFSIGVRIEHGQEAIDRIQYGEWAGRGLLPPAEYKLSCHLPGGRSVYTFCMCPGGTVVAAASEEGGLVTNGMSRYARDGQNANSALLVSVTPEDFPDDSPLAGVALQRHIEQAAFRAGGADGHAPMQTVGRFLGLPEGGAAVAPTYRPGTREASPDDYLPPYASAALREALPLLDKRLPGFATAGAVLTGAETRSSSPVRILRDDKGHSSVRRLFPCGEGAGYAGGIVSAAVDGIRAAEALLSDRLSGTN